MKRKTELAYAQGCAATRGHLSKLKRTDSFNFENRAQNIFSKITKLELGTIYLFLLIHDIISFEKKQKSAMYILHKSICENHMNSGEFNIVWVLVII